MKDTNKINIKDWAEEDRPREKMLSKGIDALSDAELLAILIGSGNAEETAVGLMQRILAASHNNLNELGKQSIHDLCQFKGIGPAKAITIAAALELGKRRKLADVQERKQIKSSRDAYELFHPILCDLPNEEFWTLYMNHSHKVIDRVRISSGGMTETSADIRNILREALLKRATALILCHNHPSGNPRPSSADNRLTDMVRQSAKLMNINLCDHLIVCDGTYYSYADEGLI